MRKELQDKLTGLLAAYSSVQAELDDIDREISEVYRQDRIENPRLPSALERTIQDIYSPMITQQLNQDFQLQGGNNEQF
jgi:hypothetical protein